MKSVRILTKKNIALASLAIFVFFASMAISVWIIGRNKKSTNEPKNNETVEFDDVSQFKEVKFEGPGGSATAWFGEFVPEYTDELYSAPTNKDKTAKVSVKFNKSIGLNIDMRGLKLAENEWNLDFRKLDPSKVREHEDLKGLTTIFILGMKNKTGAKNVLGDMGIYEITGYEDKEKTARELTYETSASNSLDPTISSGTNYYAGVFDENGKTLTIKKISSAIAAEEGKGNLDEILQNRDLRNQSVTGINVEKKVDGDIFTETITYDFTADIEKGKVENRGFLIREQEECATKPNCIPGLNEESYQELNRRRFEMFELNTRDKFINYVKSRGGTLLEYK